MATGPIFVAGCPRSGTSALSWAIAAHPGYWTSAETHFFYYLLRNDAEAIRDVHKLSSDPGQWLDKHGIGLNPLLAYLGIGLDQMMRGPSGGHHWIDGSPENVLVGGPLLEMFPSAHMFIVVRDPRSVCLSMLTSGFSPHWAKDIDAAIREWKHYILAGRKIADAHPERVLTIKQEDMRQEPDVVASRIADRIGLAAPGIVAAFLKSRTVNSSFDRNSYAQASPYREGPTPVIEREQFMTDYGAYILRETAELASPYGYYPPSPA